MMKLMWVLVVGVMVVGCTQLGPDGTGGSVESMVGEVVNDEMEKIDDETMRVAQMYGDLACSVNDPEFWSDFWEEQSMEEVAEEEAQMQALYEAHGFESEDDAADTLELHWGEENFKQGVKRWVGEKCPEANSIVNEVLEMSAEEAGILET